MSLSHHFTLTYFLGIPYGYYRFSIKNFKFSRALPLPTLQWIIRCCPGGSNCEFWEKFNYKKKFREISQKFASIRSIVQFQNLVCRILAAWREVKRTRGKWHTRCWNSTLDVIFEPNCRIEFSIIRIFFY